MSKQLEKNNFFSTLHTKERDKKGEKKSSIPLTKR